MKTLFSIIVIWMVSSVALGVGSSTIAISSYLTALSDGKIDDSERKMLGVVYYVLRLAMIMITISVAIVSIFYPGTIAGMQFIWILVGVLYLNSFLMTKHWISFKVGPALQAATWYTLGFLFTVAMFGLYEVTATLFLGFFIGDLILALVIVNGFMYWHQRHKRSKTAHK